jgi:hypothetical protein
MTRDLLPQAVSVPPTTLMERLMHFLTERQEVFCPSLACSEVRIFGIELEPIPV